MLQKGSTGRKYHSQKQFFFLFHIYPNVITQIIKQYLTTQPVNLLKNKGAPEFFNNRTSRDTKNSITIHILRSYFKLITITTSENRNKSC